MSGQAQPAGCFVGPVGVVQIIFLVLKLAGVISWSWIWVLSPMWIICLIALAAALFTLGAAVVEVFSDWRADRRRGSGDRRLW
jgi:hypothetical protein